MSVTQSSRRPLVFVAMEGRIAELPGALESACVRGRLRLDTHDKITSASLASNQVLRGLLRKTKESGGRLHLVGLVSDGGVSASLLHLFALIDAAKSAQVRVVVHALLDGVDVASGSAGKFVDMLGAKLEAGVGRIGTISGRTWGMAPEGRWERIERVYRAITADGVDRADSPARGVETACLWGVPEQFAPPFIVFDYPGVSLVDTAVHFHFAAEGARELVEALAAPHFVRFARKTGRAPFAGRFACMTPYDAQLGLPTLFPRAPDPAELLLDLLEDPAQAALNLNEGSPSEIARSAQAALAGGRHGLVLVDLANPFNASRGRVEAVTSAALDLAQATRAVGGGAILLGSRDASDSAPFVYLGDEPRKIPVEMRTLDLVPTVLSLLGISRSRDSEEASATGV